LFNTETELIEQLKQGNESAFKFLVKHYQEMILKTCYHFIRDNDEADDIAQDVFIEVYRSIKSFKTQSKLSTWMYRIAVNKSLNAIRKKKQTERLKHIQDFFSFSNVSDQSISPIEHKVEEDEQYSLLLKTIYKLPENQRTAFILNKYDELSYKEVAEIMQTSISSVESLIFRAKKNLQKKLSSSLQKK